MNQEDDKEESNEQQDNEKSELAVCNEDTGGQQSVLNSVDDYEDKVIKDEAVGDEKKEKTEIDEDEEKADESVTLKDNYYSSNALNINLNMNNLDMKTNTRSKRIEDEASSSPASTSTNHQSNNTVYIFLALFLQTFYKPISMLALIWLLLICFLDVS